MSRTDPEEQPEVAPGETLYAVSSPPAVLARDILDDRRLAEAMGYGWLHDQDTAFARAFREQVRRQAELYERWLAQDDTPAPGTHEADPGAADTGGERNE